MFLVIALVFETYYFYHNKASSLLILNFDDVFTKSRELLKLSQKNGIIPNSQVRPQGVNVRLLSHVETFLFKF